MTPNSIVEAPMKKSILPKAITAVLAGGALAFSLTACSGGDSSGDSASASASQSVESSAAGGAASDSASSPASDPASSPAAESASTSAEAGSADAQTCKSILKDIDTAGDSLDDKDDAKSALPVFEKISGQMKDYEGQLQDETLKQDVAAVADFMDTASDGIRTGKSDEEMTKLMQGKESSLDKAQEDLEKCAGV